MQGGSCGVPWVGAALQTQMLPHPIFPGFYLRGELVLQPHMAGGGRGTLLCSPLQTWPPPAQGMSVLEGVRIRPSVLAWLNLGTPPVWGWVPAPQIL